MTDQRREAEQAVIEAARKWAALPDDAPDLIGVEATTSLLVAINTLDSLPTPAPAGETERVRVAVYRCSSGIIETAALEPDEDPEDEADAGVRLVAIITADISTKPPAVPEIKGDVE